MKISGITFLHFLLLYQRALSDKENTIIGELGGNIVLPCLNLPFKTNITVTRWMKGGAVLATHKHSLPGSATHAPPHISILDNSSLSFAGLMTIDEEVYRCETEPKSTELPRAVNLLIADGPKDMVVNVNPGTHLRNNLWFVIKGQTVTFNCSSKSYPTPNMTWMFEDLNENKSRAFKNDASLNFEIINIQPEDQRNYTCIALNTISNKTEAKRLELLVYHAPDIHPDCLWQHGSQPDQGLFNCTWYGAYPTPNLTVELDSTDGGVLLSRTQQTENFQLTLNRSMLYDGQEISCAGQHITQRLDADKICTLKLAAPYPMGQPMVAALEGTNITLTCSESKSLPPAKSIWQRGINQEPIVPSSKYILVEQGPNLSLTIVNASMADQGLYFCYSENTVAAKELEVVLTIRASADKSGAMVGVFISVLIVAAGIVVGYFMYTRRDRICLGLPFRVSNDTTADVLNLIESDDEEIFHDAVPRLPPLSNGHVSVQGTTLVEIHRIQSSDHEDNMTDTDLDHHTHDRTLDHPLSHPLDHPLDHMQDHTQDHMLNHPLDHPLNRMQDHTQEHTQDRTLDHTQDHIYNQTELIDY
ncbi:V-set and immunoglobulin domain-containing protein 10 [Silurus meridionalis]|uniref:Ig-like domain-containing protein n=1 Tax=Silurus meridionalis TaxID=175797 RepID=A0A8T0A7X9_SILME|nr:V-set and immunoglobulin domain-containing protein 10 [Silurus meridionalis]XP_046697512.1 V-set and immunoglobulin domain-containing protein 10 [Silurus meridionalis]XP_046697513.1 V-set and immunoglobulin domain-containing protein 10 [Silurus meridionalis]KAF7687245.1 hypothetical protein HF521_014473 [Silurus meridionalis]